MKPNGPVDWNFKIILDSCKLSKLGSIWHFKGKHDALLTSMFSWKFYFGIQSYSAKLCQH